MNTLRLWRVPTSRYIHVRQNVTAYDATKKASNQVHNLGLGPLLLSMDNGY